jgi:hypothetical protein
MVQFIRLRGDFGFRAVFISDHRSDRTASQLLSQREAARMVPNFAQAIILAYGTCASAKICRHSGGAWLNAHHDCAKNKINVDY